MHAADTPALEEASEEVRHWAAEKGDFGVSLRFRV